MKKFLLLLLLFALAAVLTAQTNIPVGTVLPVTLNSPIEGKKCKPGQTITTTVAQDVPLYNGTKIKAGTRVVGEVLAVTPAGNSQPATITLRFNGIGISGQTKSIVTDLRALASPLDVELARTQISGDDRGSTPPWSQTTTLIGGDVAYRAEGIVQSGENTVGTTVYAGDWGVLSRVSSNADKKCRGAIQENDKPQALWVFSHDACGTYGLNAVIADAGRSNPEGRIVLASTNGDLKLRSGSALLLRVNGTGDNWSRN